MPGSSSTIRITGRIGASGPVPSPARKSRDMVHRTLQFERALAQPSGRQGEPRGNATSEHCIESVTLTSGTGATEDRPVLARVLSAALLGVEAVLVRVEVDVASGLPAFTTVGLPDSAVRESRERVRTAIRNAGFAFPSDRITVNLAPADVRKEGTSFDLPIALGILAATGAVRNGQIGLFAVVGELALDGQIQGVRGALAVGLACRRQGIGTLVVPGEHHTEAQAVDGLRVLAAPTLREAG